MPDAPLNPSDPPPNRRSPFEWSLAALRPADADVGRPSFMFKAGQASRDRAVRFWQCVSAGLVVLMVASAIAAYGYGAASAVQHREATHENKPLLQPVTPFTSPVPDESTSTESFSRPSVAPFNAPTSTALPADILAALEHRRKILSGGLDLIPDTPPTFTPEPQSTPAYPDVLAAPRVEKPPPPPR
jgi:hypothetical protein